jgi:GNAT superfamily N-acetyltransferase
MRSLLGNGPSIREARIYELGAVTAVLAEAFLDGDLAGWLVPDRERRRAVYADYFLIWAEFFLMHGQVDTTEDLDAAALWWPVGNKLVMDIPDYDERLAKTTGEALGRFVALDLTMDLHHPMNKPHHYLAFLAVHPDRQGAGLGRALLAHHLALLDDENVPAYLEATGPRNRALYVRHGYKLLMPVTIPDGPDLYPMWRPPHTDVPSLRPV